MNGGSAAGCVDWTGSAMTDDRPRPQYGEYATPEQQEVAAAYIAQLDAAQVFPRPIVTQLVPLVAFYRGEDYHQDYAMKNPHNPYIQVCDIPKIGALEVQFPELFTEYIR